MGFFDLDDDICDRPVFRRLGWKPYCEHYAKYDDGFMRYYSFIKKGEINSRYSPLEFAVAGLFRTGESDECACFHCGNLICGWEYDDDPAEKHANQSLHCNFIKSRILLKMPRRSLFLDDWQKYDNSEEKVADWTETDEKVNRYESFSLRAWKTPMWRYDDSEEKIADRTETDEEVVQDEDKWLSGRFKVTKIKWRPRRVLPERSDQMSKKLTGNILEADEFYTDVIAAKPRKIGDKFDSGLGQGGGYKFAKSAMTEGEMFMEGTIFNYRSDVIIKSGMNEAPYGIQICQTESSCKSAEYTRDGYIEDLFSSSTLQSIRVIPYGLFDNYRKDQTVVPHGDRFADSATTRSCPYDEDIEEEIRALEQLLMCKVCLDKDSCIVFFPCRHMATCEACERFLQRCPVCRSAIDEAVKLNEE